MAEAIPHCSLRPDQLGAQAARWGRLAEAAARIERSGSALTLAFGADAPVETIRQVIAVESECCPFFAIGYDDAERTLRLGVNEADHAPALDAIAERLGV